MLEYKSVSFDIKATSGLTSESDWVIEGYASTYDLDTGDDKILPGAFTETIKERFSEPRARNGKSKIKVLWQHKTDELIGSLLELREDEKGLYCKMQIINDPDFPRAAQAYKLAKMGELDSFSIGFKPLSIRYELSDPEDEDSDVIRIIPTLKLYEVSIVTFPMNEKAEFTNVKEDNQVNDQVMALLKEIKEMIMQTQVTEVVEEKGQCTDCDHVCEAQECKDEIAEVVAEVETAAVEEKTEEETVTEVVVEAAVEEKTETEPVEEVKEEISDVLSIGHDSVVYKSVNVGGVDLLELKQRVDQMFTLDEVKQLIVETVNSVLAEQEKNISKSEVNLEDIVEAMLTKDFTL